MPASSNIAGDGIMFPLIVALVLTAFPVALAGDSKRIFFYKEHAEQLFRIRSGIISKDDFIGSDAYQVITAILDNNTDTSNAPLSLCHALNQVLDLLSDSQLANYPKSCRKLYLDQVTAGKPELRERTIAGIPPSWVKDLPVPIAKALEAERKRDHTPLQWLSEETFSVLVSEWDSVSQSFCPNFSARHLEYLQRPLKQSRKLQAIGPQCFAKMKHIKKVKLSGQMVFLHHKIFAWYNGSLTAKTIANMRPSQIQNFSSQLDDAQQCAHLDLSMVHVRNTRFIPQKCVKGRLLAKEGPLGWGAMLQGLQVGQLRFLKDIGNLKTAITFSKDDYQYMTNAVIKTIISAFKFESPVPSDILNVINGDDIMFSFLHREPDAAKDLFTFLTTTGDGRKQLKLFLHGRKIDNKAIQLADLKRRIFHLVAFIIHAGFEDVDLETVLKWLHSLVRDVNHGVLIYQTIEQLVYLPPPHRLLPSLLVKTYLSPFLSDNLDEEEGVYYARMQPKSTGDERNKEKNERKEKNELKDKNELKEKVKDNEEIEENDAADNIVADEDLYSRGSENENDATENTVADEDLYAGGSENEIADEDLYASGSENETDTDDDTDSDVNDDDFNAIDPKFWNFLHKRQQRKDGFDCKSLMEDKVLLGKVFSPKYPSIPQLHQRLSLTMKILKCPLDKLASFYLAQAAYAPGSKLDGIGLLFFGDPSSLMAAAEPVLRTIADRYSIDRLHDLMSYAITTSDASDTDGNRGMTFSSIPLGVSTGNHSFMDTVRRLLVTWCEEKTMNTGPKDIEDAEWLRRAISAFLIVSGDRYLPHSLMQHIVTLSKKYDSWLALLQLYEHLFALQDVDVVVNRLATLIDWYAPDILDDVYMAIPDIVNYLYYDGGGGGSTLAKIRTRDAKAFVTSYPKAAVIVYRLIKHSGSNEKRFLSLLERANLDAAPLQNALERDSGASFFHPLEGYHGNMANAV